MITYHNKTEYYGTMAERPDAAVFGVGQCLVAGVEYTSNGVVWSGDAAAAISASVTGLVTTAGTVSEADTVVGAIGKLVGNVALKADNIIAGFASSAGTVSNAQTVVQAISSLDGNIALKAARITPTFTGTAATDSPTLGAEFLTGGTWTSTDWTGDAATGWIHAATPVTPLSYVKAAVSTTKYQIAYTVTRSAGSFTIAFGGQSLSSITTSGAFGPTATTTGNLAITPTADFVGTIIISIKAITTAATSTFTITNSTSLARLECRAPSTDATSQFLGVNSGWYMTSGTTNTAVGPLSLQNVTSGGFNVALGYLALSSTTSGSSNTAISPGALVANTSGTQNVAIGRLTLQANTTGVANVAVGYNGLSSVTTGMYNTAVGVSGGTLITTSYYNTCIGGLSAGDVSTGGSNTALGYNTGRGITTGSYNTILGAGVTGLPAALGSTIILATGDGVIRTLQSATGGLFTTCVTPNAQTANATLTIANLLTNIVTCTSASAVALTLPTGTLTDAGVSAALPVDMGFSWSVINLGSADGAVTMTADTAHTYVGAAVVAIGTSARFTTRKTVANTYVTYRIA